MDSATLGVIGGILGGFIGLCGAAAGTYVSVKNTKGPMERTFMIRAAIVMWVVIIVFLSLLLMLPNPYKFLLWIPYGVFLPLVIAYMNRRLQIIRQIESETDASKL